MTARVKQVGVKFGRRHAECQVEALALQKVNWYGAWLGRYKGAALLAVDELHVEVADERRGSAVSDCFCTVLYGRLEAALTHATLILLDADLSGPIGSSTLDNGLGLMELHFDEASIGTTRLLVRITHCVVIEVNADLCNAHGGIILSEKGAVHE